MKILQGDAWKRRGVSLLWGGEALSGLAQPQNVTSIRQFFAMVGQWPDDLPCNGGDTLVVAGLEGCIDLMDPVEAEAWLKSDLLPAVLAFQDEYSLEAALVFWMPTGKNRVKMNRATVSGLKGQGKEPANDRRISFDPQFFDFNNLQRFGK